MKYILRLSWSVWSLTLSLAGAGVILVSLYLCWVILMASLAYAPQLASIAVEQVPPDKLLAQRITSFGAIVLLGTGLVAGIGFFLAAVCFVVRCGNRICGEYDDMFRRAIAKC